MSYLLATTEYTTDTSGVGVTGATAASASMALTNAITMQPTELVRFASLTGMYVEFDLTTARDVDTIWVGYSNATSAATVRVRGATSQANLTSAPGYDSTALTSWPTTSLGDLREKFPRGNHFLNRPGSTKTYRWWRLDFADAANPDGYYQFGVALFALAWVPATPAALGAMLEGARTGGRSDAMGGQRYPRGLTAVNVLETQHDYLTQTEALTLRDIQRRRANVRPVLGVLLPSDTLGLMDDTAYGLLETTAVRIPYYNTYSATIRVVEMY